MKTQNNIEFLYIAGKKGAKVKLQGKICGEIKAVDGGFQYYPKNSKKGGEIFKTLTGVQHSLETEFN